MKSQPLHKKRSVVAILCDFPVDALRKGDTQYGQNNKCSWLQALNLSLSQQDEFEIHWVVCLRGSRANDELIGNQYFHILPQSSLRISQACRYWPERMRIARVLRRIDADIVHAWGTELFYAVAGAGFKGPKVLSIQGLLKECARQYEITWFEKKQLRFEKAVISQFDIITGESPLSVEMVQRQYHASRTEILEHAVLVHFASCVWTPSQTPTFIYVGRMSHAKGVDTLLKAFMDSRLRSVKLLLAGSGSFTSLAREVSCNIQFLGHLSRAELIQVLSQSWCLVHPSLIDTGPTVVKEARVMGLPVILTEMCGAKQYVEEELSGYIIPPNDVEALINAVLKMMSREKVVAMGSYGLKACRSRLSIDVMGDRVLQIYRALVHSSSEI